MKTLFVIIWLMMLSIGQQLNHFIYEKNVNKTTNRHSSYYAFASADADVQPIQASNNSRDHEFFLRKIVNMLSGKDAT